MDSFWRLNNDRQLGMSVGPIPFSSIERYARRYGIDCIDAFDTFLALIKAMDSTYVEIRNKPQDPNLLTEVSVDDVDGVKDVLRRARKRREDDDPPEETEQHDGPNPGSNPTAENPRRHGGTRKGSAGHRKPRQRNGQGDSVGKASRSGRRKARPDD